MSARLLRVIAPALVVSIWHAVAAAQGTPVQVLDLNTSGAGAGVASSFARIGEIAFFAGHGLDEGVELWQTDGTEAGTALAVDILPGPESSSPQCITAVGSTLYFSASDGVHGPELWTSDGTPAGTQMVADAVPGPDGVSPCDMVASGDLVFFVSGGPTGTALWRSDGSEEGTFHLRDGWVTEPTAFDGELYFASNDEDHGVELYASDGTLLGTRRVADLEPGEASSFPRSFAVAPAGLLFRAGGFSDSRLWITDGTEAGTVPQEPPGRLCGNLNLVGDEVLLGGVEGDDCGVWRTDGTPEGTEFVVTVGDDYYLDLTGPFTVAWDDDLVVPVNDDRSVELRKVHPLGGSVTLLRSISCGIGFRDLTPFDDALFFAAKAYPDGWELYRSDGTPAGTQAFGPVVPGPRGSNASHITPLGGRLLFAAQDVTHGFEPWITDGTEQGTHLVRDVHLGNSRGVGRIAEVAGTVFLQATRRPRWDIGNTERGGSIQEPELWRTDGTAPGTAPVPWSDVVEWASVPVATDGALTFFVGRNTGESWALWSTDGTSAGTRRLIDLELDVLGDERGQMVGGRLFFTDGNWAYLSDGAPAGTQRLTGVRVSSAAGFAALPDALLFNSLGAIWRTDGTVLGTGPLTASLAASESPFAVLGDEAFFFAWDGVHGFELWASDGTSEGTRMVRDIATGVFDGTGQPFAIASWRGAIYFAGRDLASGTELWKTDGTDAGTARVLDLAPGFASSHPQLLTPAGHRLFFTADDGVRGRELAVTDGTPGGTRIVADIHSGSEGSEPARLAAVAGDVYFAADDGVHGPELWFSDGSEAKTRLVGEIRPGPSGAGVHDLTATDHGLLFSAADGRTGPELWRTTCGDGVVGADEECDEGGSNGASGSCCSPSCSLLSAEAEPGLTCGLEVEDVRLRSRPRRPNVGGRILVRGEIAPGSQLGAAADLRIDVLGAGGELYATVTWSRAACEERPRSVRCVDPGGDAVVELRLRDSGGWALRAKLKGLTLPTRLAGPVTVSFGEAGSRPLDWTSSECRDARSRLTCSNGD